VTALRRALMCFATATAVVAGSSSVALAESPRGTPASTSTQESAERSGATSRPGQDPGSWTSGVPTRGLTTYPQMVAKLKRLSHAGVTVSRAGTSNENRGIWLAKAGHGPKKILITAQQHGNEPQGSEAALRYLTDLATSPSPQMRRLRSSVTVYVMPRVNPDGAAHNWRQNFDPECSAETANCTPGRGIDGNRWHDPGVEDQDVPAPETRAVRAVHRQVRPDLMLDVHGQLSYVDDQGAGITASIAWPVIKDADRTPARDAAVKKSKQVSVVAAEAIDQRPDGVVSQFPLGDDAPLTARNGYALQGTPTVLIEQRSDGGQKDLERIVGQGYDALMAVTTAEADGSVNGVDAGRADAIPERGLQVGPEHPRLPAGCLPTRPHGGGQVQRRSESLYDLVSDHEGRVRTEGSGYTAPTKRQACAFANAYSKLEHGLTRAAAADVAPYGYSVLELTDPSTHRRHLVLAERPDAEGEYPRGWGMFVYSPRAASSATVIDPYTGSATFSARQAVQTFDRGDAQNLLLDGAHRSATRADAASYEPANPTVAPESAMRRVAAAAVDRNEVSLQILGTGTDASSVTSATVPPSATATTLTRALRSGGFGVCLYGDGTCSQNGSTGNLLAQDARALQAHALVVSPTYQVRSKKAEREKFADALDSVM
jgi:hypothetical protein